MTSRTARASATNLPVVRCHKCGHEKFEVVDVDDVAGAHKTISMVVCEAEACRIVIGLIPYKDMKVDVGILEQ